RPALDKDEKEGAQPKPVCGLDVPFATVGGSFIFKHIRVDELVADKAARVVGVKVDLDQAKIDELCDQRASWEQIAPLRVAGFEYKAIKDLGPEETWRLDKLDEQYGDAATFQPQPYLWLAKIKQQAGYDAAAIEVRVRLEKNRTRYGDFGRVKRIGRHILAWTIRYGYRPSNAIKWLLAWSVVCTVLFWDLPNSGQAIEAKPPLKGPALQFNPFVYAVDTLVPIVDLHQKSQWFIQPPSLAPWREVSNPPSAGSGDLLARVGQAVWRTCWAYWA
ncbi:MAG: hypothetical protein HY060_02100, partial [Proteobacteria bacterium]|nr:hypothetical protein [Pseudomonadota bacterium]